MPQMMPMSWLTLFTMFSLALMMFAAMNYFTGTQTPKQPTKKMITKTNMNWKW
uniref:ATP synthase complex subunit 8 n=1 Tax=Bifiditermes mutubae TaxID=2603941 RepID=A0A8X8RGS9_9NEOP|nr:ATP synthase F0 subunit 8 [Bifiditermes mutubae]